MNQTAKNLIRIAGVVASLGAAVWALRDRLLPPPEVSDAPPPRFRGPDESPAPDRDLTDIKGVGPVTAGKLADAGITDVATVAGMSPTDLAAAVGTTESTAAGWIESARTLT